MVLQHDQQLSVALRPQRLSNKVCTFFFVLNFVFQQTFSFLLLSSWVSVLCFAGSVLILADCILHLNLSFHMHCLRPFAQSACRMKYAPLFCLFRKDFLFSKRLSNATFRFWMSVGRFGLGLGFNIYSHIHIWRCIQGGEDASDAWFLQVIFRQRALYWVALLRHIHMSKCIQGGEDASDASSLCHFPPKSPILSGSFAIRDLQLSVSYVFLPPCMYIYIYLQKCICYIYLLFSLLQKNFLPCYGCVGMNVGCFSVSGLRR